MDPVLRTNEFHDVVLLSGGIDSAACLHLCLRSDASPTALFVGYGQLAEAAERKASALVAGQLGVPWSEVSARIATPIGAGLVPHRNLFLLSIALAGLKLPIGRVWIGVHAGTGYPDCSPEFIKAMQRAVDVSDNGRISICAPFLEWHKEDVLSYAKATDLPLSNTWSCEASANQPCLQCLSCQDRAAFHV